MGLIKQAALLGLSSALAGVAVYHSDIQKLWTEDVNADVKEELETLELQSQRYEIQAEVLVQKARLRDRQAVEADREAQAQALVDEAAEAFPELMKVVRSKTEDLFELELVAREVLGRE